MLNAADVEGILDDAGFQCSLYLPLWRRGNVFVQCVPSHVYVNVLDDFELIYSAALPVDYDEFMDALANAAIKWEK